MRVVVAVIPDSQQRLLITRRSQNTTHAGFWELPGGKIEDQELASDALHREIKEELGIDVVGYHFLGEVHHTYHQKQMSIFIYYIDKYQGEASCCEGQMDLQWVLLEDFKNYAFPEANSKIIELIKVSRCIGRVELLSSESPCSSQQSS